MGDEFEPEGQAHFQCSHINSFRPYLLMVVAEKGANSTWDRHPIQVHYRRDEWHKKTCNEQAARFRASPRPAFSNRGPLRAQPEPFSAQGAMTLVASWDVAGSYEDLLGGERGEAGGLSGRAG